VNVQVQTEHCCLLARLCLPHTVNCGRLCFWRNQSVVFVYEISPELLNGFAPNSLGRRVWSLSQTSLKVKDKDQRSRSPGTKNGIFPAFRKLVCGLCLVEHL